jgi:hypothetical protein
MNVQKGTISRRGGFEVIASSLPKYDRFAEDAARQSCGYHGCGSPVRGEPVHSRVL